MQELELYTHIGIHAIQFLFALLVFLWIARKITEIITKAIQDANETIDLITNGIHEE